MAIGYVTLGSNDFDKAVAFYTEVMGLVGAKAVMTNDRMVLFGSAPGAAMLGVCKPHDEQSASAGNGTMVALNAADQDTVDKVHAKALELGGTDEGAPGLRGDNFYGGYFRDLDGNKLVAFTMS